ncbi:O-methyltransferase [Beijerinckia indica]|uniref:O-methyltransferase family 3 n=1 Tax=Beijerinckia indica subsp. indica (strain ATCC 9039 / DSM 1715 / NCIMB 8712) TaxID=395963 RepID=B2IC53_BEII9|nr:O-methyltransferase [Beijerinckia indica]ACB95308.1 O-methyltransferase family 3 [Beijerinckia indica subsp. indica ATCC 9039]
MSQDQWTAVDHYISDLFIPPDAALEAALTRSAAAGLPSINVAPNQGKLLHMLARLIGARAILEIGTLGAYSTIWLARALPTDGFLITLEAKPEHAKIAQENLRQAGLTSQVEVRLGPAIETLPQIAAENKGPFDLVFIDADKQGTPEYFRWALDLSRKGSLIIVDNVVRGGKVIDATSTDPNVQGIQRFHQWVAAEPRVSATALQTVGSKGYDGLTFIEVIN